MRELLLSSALAIGLIGPAYAETWIVALPETFPGDNQDLAAELWNFFTGTLGAGDTYKIVNANTPGLIASIDVPDSPKFDRAKWRAKRFARENAALGRHLKNLNAGGAGIDLTGTLRHIALQRNATSPPAHLLLVGNPAQVVEDWSAMSMDQGDRLFVPAPNHHGASIAKTPYGMAAEGAKGLAGVFVHLCALGSARSPREEAALQRFWGDYVNARGGVLVSWNADLPSCFASFAAQDTTPVNAPEYGTGDGDLAMIEIADPVEQEAIPADDVPDQSFNLFTSVSHPNLLGVDVTTGVEYAPSLYPDVYDHAWCYFNVERNGLSMRFDLGRKDHSAPVLASKIEASARSAAGISISDIEAGRRACIWPKE